MPRISEGAVNILWVYVEDTNPWMSCYGDSVIETPNIDRLASDGVRFDRAYVTSGVCSPTRSAIITGMYQTSIGAHEHYSSFSEWRGTVMESWDPNHLGVRTLPEMFRAAGYYTFNEGKEHYNFVYQSEDLYDHKGKKEGFKGAVNGSEWTGRKSDQPFFGQIQLKGDKFHNPPKVVRPEEVSVMPYYPDKKVFRETIANHYNTISKLDEIVGNIMKRLSEDGLLESTVVFFFSDHGCKLPRHKQFLYEGGIRVPLIIAGPNIPSNGVRDDLVSSLDISATSLALAGIDIPDHIHGMDLFEPSFHRDYVVAARDRCDFTIDRIRSVTSRRYKYIRNFMTDRPYMQPNYRSEWGIMKTLRDMYDNGELNKVQARFVDDIRPAEEFYDLLEDPHETNNLIHSYDRDHAIALAEHRDILYRWIIETDDKGRFPESNDALRAVLQRWGDRAVNKEYERVREEQ
ncbi:sulfatase family protein [Reichenbachiella versicolor]|uniref:sulfatase family protein n=1 Tax=Reichenbachiella versicolor TaxID=1821036 RepID=UPI0013A57713|nr:sulfatase [Reichenbachiella versicolor]